MRRSDGNREELVAIDGSMLGSGAMGEEIAPFVGISLQFLMVIPLTLSPSALHLDCTIALVRPGLGMICREWLLSDLPDTLKDWDWIEATEEEAAWLGVNGLALSPDIYIFDSAHQRQGVVHLFRRT